MIVTVTEAAGELAARLHGELLDSDYAEFMFGATMLEIEERLKNALLSGKVRPRSAITGMFDDEQAFLGAKASVLLDDALMFLTGEGLNFDSSKAAATSGMPEKAAPPVLSATTPDTTGMVAWQAAILERIDDVTKRNGGKTTARQVLQWCRANGPRDVFPKEQPDERSSFAWIDREGNRHTNQLSTVANVWSAWRSSGTIPAKQ